MAFDPKAKKRWLKARRRARRIANGTHRTKSWCRVYGLFDADGVCYYVGQTRLELKDRMRWHRKSKTRPVSLWLQAEHEAGRRVFIELIEEPATWDVTEIIWIERMRQLEQPLLNRTRGGRDRTC
jgi:hypothetical protein